MSDLDRNFYATIFASGVGVIVIVIVSVWLVRKDNNLRKFLRLAAQYIRYTIIVKNWQYAPEMALSLNELGYIECVNNTFKKKLGYTDDEIDNQRMSLILSPGDLSRFEEFKSSYADKEIEVMLRVNVICKDSTQKRIPAEMSITRMTDDLDQTKVSYAVYIHSIKHRLDNEEAHEVALRFIKEDWSRSVNALYLTQGGGWDWDMETDVVHCDLPFRKQFGIRSEETVTSKDLMGLVFSKDREKVNMAMINSMETSTMYTVDYRVPQRNGELNLIRCWGVPILSENGKVIKYYGAIQLLQSNASSDDVRH